MHRSIAVALLLVVAAVGASTPVTAQDDTGPVDELFGSDDSDEKDDGLLSSVGTWAREAPSIVIGLRHRTTRWVASKTGISDSPTAEEAADDVQEVANDNVGALQTYVNARATASPSYDTFEFDFDVAGETETRYVVADVANGSYENASMVESIDREADESCTLEGAAATEADDEMESVIDTYVDPDEDVTRSLFSRIAAEYGGNIDCTFI